MEGLDHIAITVVDVEVTMAWYQRVLDAQLLYEEMWRAGALPVALLQVGASLMSLHDVAAPKTPHAQIVTPGSVDVCFRVGGPIDAILTSLTVAGVDVVEGPVPRPAATGAPGISLYVRDPDGNLVELLSTDATSSDSASIESRFRTHWVPAH